MSHILLHIVSRFVLVFQIVIQVPVTLVHSFSYFQLNHEFSVVITAGAETDNNIAFLPNNVQVLTAKFQQACTYSQSWAEFL